MIVATSFGMKQLFLFLFFAISSVPAFAQFPLGSNAESIKVYFDDNIPYASLQTFKTREGVNALCFTKVKVVGDYTFYLDESGNCSSYVVTYDVDELPELNARFDKEFCRLRETKWQAEDQTFNVTLIPAKDGENFFSILYTPARRSVTSANTLASN